MDEEEQIGPEQAKLRSRVAEYYANGMRSVHFDWAEEAASLSIEERAKAMNAAFDEMDKWNALTDEQKMRRQMVDIYVHVRAAIDALPYPTLEQICAGMTSEQEGAHKAWGELDAALVLIGNWVDRAEVRKSRPEPRPDTEPPHE